MTEARQGIEASLSAAFAEADSTIPFDVLANYLAEAQIALVQWWLEKRKPHTPEKLAQTFHRLQRAAICWCVRATGQSVGNKFFISSGRPTHISSADFPFLGRC